MTDYPTIRPLDSASLDEAIAQECIPVLRDVLSKAGEFHRLRVTDLPLSIIKRLCEELGETEEWVVKSLCNSKPNEIFEASATKIIELRNTEKRPLVVFIPAGMRTAAEDSLDIATFQQIQLNSISEKLVPRLLAQLPHNLQQSITEMLKFLRERNVIRDEDLVVRYLLTIIENGASEQAAGGALFVFGLVPDFQLFSNVETLNEWISRNENVVEKLTDLRRPLQERISQLKLQPNTIQSNLFSYLRDHMVGIESIWTSEIALNPTWHNLSFHEWPFEDAGLIEQVRLVLEPLSLPRQVPDQFSQTISLPVLDLDSNTNIKVSFRSIPGPKEVVAWESYRFQILAPSEDVPVLLWESNNISKPKQKAKISRTIKASELRDILEEGTYFLRVEAYGADGAILTKTQPIDPSDPNGRKENESENFLIVHGGAVVDPPDAPRAIFTNSLMDCYFALLSKRLFSNTTGDSDIISHEALFGRWDSSEGAAVRSEVNFELLASTAAGYTIRMPGILRKIELAILKNPTCLDNIFLDLRHASSPADISIETTPVEMPETALFEDLLQSRQGIFEAILRQIQDRQDGHGDEYTSSVIETCDLLALESLICRYADTYIKLAGKILSESDGKKKAANIEVLAALDTVKLQWPKKHGNPGKGFLVGPTHPLRLLWHLQHAKYRQSIVDDLQNSLAESSDPARLLKLVETRFLPVNMPLVMFDRRGRSYIEQDLLTPFWSLFLPTSYSAGHYDFSFVKMQVRTRLGIRNSSSHLGGIEASSIAYRVFDYLQRHPYIEQLKINVFNPGDGDRVAQALREIERLRRNLPKSTSQTLPEMRYAIHLLTSSEQLNQSGEALDALLDPEKQVAEDDEFTIGSTSLLQPKLLISRSTQEEFLRNSQEFVAHITILLEQFPVDGRLGDSTRFSRSSFVGGLVQESNTQLETASSTFGWVRGIKVESPASNNQVEKTLLQAFKTSQALQAGLAGSKDLKNVPVIALRLDQIDQGLIRAIHDVSDQVLIIDRNLGLDFFDSASSPQDIGYLLDFSPSYVRGDGERLLLTTRCTEELISLVRPAIDMSGVSLPAGSEASVLEVLRSISGKLALRLFKGLNATREVIGLLFARLLLEQAGLLKERFLIPIDSHQDWFSELDSNSSRSRADILLVAVDPLTKTIDITVIEVKLRSHLTSGDRVQLYAGMREQAENTIRQLQHKFDPEYMSRPRADFLICCKELYSLLNFYIERSLRYKLLSQEEGLRIQQFISSLENGYSLTFRKRGIVYSQDTAGNHLDEDEIDFPVHRFGLDTANLLVADLAATASSLNAEPEDEQSERPEDSISSSLRSIPDSTIDSLRSFFEAPIDNPPSSHSLESLTETDESFSDKSDSDTEDTNDYDEDLSSLPKEEEQRDIPDQEDELAMEENSSSDDEDVGSSETNETLENPQILSPDILLGSSEITPQYGLLGKNANARVAIDLTGCNTISLFGVQGFGKSYTLGVISEMGSQQMSGINALSTPLATVFFHYHKSDTYEPEFLAAVNPNNKQREIDKLLSEYQARPAGLQDILLLVPEGKLEQRKQEYPNINVQPIKFSSVELGADSWKFLLGAFGNDSFYIRQIVAIMRRYRDQLTLDALRQEIADADLTPAVRRLAEDRIALAEPYIDDSADLRSLLHPGRTIIVDLRDEWLEKEDALGLFVVIMKTFSQAKYQGKDFNKLMVFDEAHKYITESELISQVVEIIREMRHQATSIVIASQDPLSVPRSVIELTSLLVLHRMTSPQWLKHLKSAIAALDNLTEPQLASLAPGEALVWAQRSTDRRFTQKPQKVHIRPRVTRHGGGTKTAVEGATLR